MFASIAAMSAGAAEKKPLPAAKAPAAYASTKAPAAAADPTSTSSVAPAPSADPNCSKYRKRLWVEGEGWIVRRVTTCF